MKIMNITDYDGLFRVVESCKGQVHIVSNEGDDIVLTSRLSRFLLEALKNNEDGLLNELEIICDDPEDTIRLIKFLANTKE